MEPGSNAGRLPSCFGGCYPRWVNSGVIWSQRAQKKGRGWFCHCALSHKHTHTNNNTQGLTSEQEAWLESVTHGNVSTNWPPLSSNQSTNLLKNVRNFQNITEIANYPYHQAGMVDKCCSLVNT